jgi:hypothetical protein
MTRAEKIFRDLKISVEKHKLDVSAELYFRQGFLTFSVENLCFELEQKEQEITSLRAELLDIQKELV